jgi:hypothetical protein
MAGMLDLPVVQPGDARAVAYGECNLLANPARARELIAGTRRDIWRL